MVRRFVPASEGLLFADPKEPLQVRIPSGVKRRFKAAAALRGLEPNELFVKIWEHYERTGGEDAPREGR